MQILGSTVPWAKMAIQLASHLSPARALPMHSSSCRSVERPLPKATCIESPSDLGKLVARSLSAEFDLAKDVQYSKPALLTNVPFRNKQTGSAVWAIDTLRDYFEFAD